MLPTFPQVKPYTEERIERTVESLTNRADRLFMAEGSEIAQTEYDAWCKKLDAWAEACSAMTRYVSLRF